MGIAISATDQILHTKKRKPQNFNGSILQLGKQDIYFNYEKLIERAKIFGLDLNEIEISTVTNPWTHQIVLDDVTFFKSLGFNDVQSLDYVGDEGATIVWDLNEPVPDELHSKFDVIFDGGTLEHVFDVATVFKNIHAMLKPNGLIMHDNPTNNFVDHGFWQINPTVHADTYQINDYEIVDIFISVFSSDQNMHEESPHIRATYDPILFQSISIGQFPNGIGNTFMSAIKPSKFANFIKPTQGFYKRHWNNISN